MALIFSILVGIGSFLIWAVIIFAGATLFGKFIAIAFGITLAVMGLGYLLFVLSGGEKGGRDRAKRRKLVYQTQQANMLAKVTDGSPEEIVRVTLETVYEQGAKWVPKTRSVPEYLREIERRWSQNGATPPGSVRISTAVLEVVRDDCAGYPQVLEAIERAMRGTLPEGEISFQDATG